MGQECDNGFRHAAMTCGAGASCSSPNSLEVGNRTRRSLFQQLAVSHLISGGGFQTRQSNPMQTKGGLTSFSGACACSSSAEPQLTFQLHSPAPCQRMTKGQAVNVHTGCLFQANKGLCKKRPGYRIGHRSTYTSSLEGWRLGEWGRSKPTYKYLIQAHTGQVGPA